MNKRLSFFVGGPITSALSSDAFDETLRKKLEMIHRVVQELDCDLFSAHLDENWGAIDTRAVVEDVTRRDFEWMQRCDFYLAVLPVDSSGKLMRSDGTNIEIGWATALHKPIVLLSDFERDHNHLIRGLNAIAWVLELPISTLEDGETNLKRALAELLRKFGSPSSKAPPSATDDSANERTTLRATSIAPPVTAARGPLQAS